MSDRFYWASLEQPQGIFYIMAHERGVCRIAWPQESFDAIVRFHQYHAPEAPLIADAQPLKETIRQLEEYWNGQRTRFELPLYLLGTPFQIKVWTAVKTIAYGTVSTYSAIASQIGNPQAMRAVGTATGRNPVPIIVPCHRVIGKNGTLTGFRGGLRLKALMLSQEGYASFVEAGHNRFRY